MDENKVNMFVEDEKKKDSARQTAKKDKVPKGYIPINLSSAGKLSAPAKIHVRNYNGQDALDFAMATEDDMLETLIDVLVGMIWEDVEPEDLHEYDIEEIMLNVYYNYWSSVLEYPYVPLDDEYENIDTIRAERLKNDEEKLTVVLTSDHIKTSFLKKEFSEPMIIEADDFKYEFILPRIGHMMLAKEMTEEKFAEEEDYFAIVQQQLAHNEEADGGVKGKLISVSPSVKRKYLKYQSQRMKYFTSLIQCQLIKSADGVELIDIDEKREAYLVAPLSIWEKFNKEIKENAHFGIEHEITVKSPLTGKSIERRFQFRFMDFLPAMES